MAFRAKRGKRGLGERVVLDKKRTIAENVKEVLVNICRRQNGPNDTKKVNYLEAFAQLLQESDDSGNSPDYGMRVREILMCLRIPLTSNSEGVRAATLKAVRYLVRNKKDAQAVTKVNLHHLIARALDLDTDNRPERVQAVKLARKMLVFGGSDYPASLVCCLISIVQRGTAGGKEKRDELWRAGLAVLCELSCHATQLFLHSGCVRVVAGALQDCHNTPRLTEAVIASLMHLYSSPETRHSSGIDLSLVVAPYTQLPYSDTAVDSSRLESAATSLLSLLRCWPGLLHLNSNHLSTKPLLSLLNVLYLDSYQARSTILDLLYKSLSLQVPEWTDEFEVAMRTADPAAPRPAWRLSEGFVAAEGRDLVPHLARSRPNLVESHTALLLSAFLQNGLVPALIEVIVTGEGVISVRATVLLGQFLHLVSSLLPHEISATQQCLPILASYVDSTHPTYSRQKSIKALAAVTGLHKLHNLKKHGARPSSLLLEQVLENSGQSQGGQFVGDRLKLPSSCPSAEPGATDVTNIKESGVTTHRDPQSWRWDLVLSTLRWPSETVRRLEDTNCKAFLKNLTDFFLPSSNMFSRLELDSGRTRYMARVGQALLDFLLSSIPVSNTASLGPGQEPEATTRLDSFIADVMVCVQEVISSNNPHNCVFSPTRLTNTACQLYFLFLGRLSRTETGRNCLDKHNSLSLLSELLRARHEIYLKLVISAMDYRQEDWGSRSNLLVKALTSSSEQGRVYATRWVGVLARMGVPSIAVYGVELLVRQLGDLSLTVASTALNILDEVCDDKMFLESLVSNSQQLLSTNLDRLGDRGRLLVTRCVASGNGFSLMSRNNWLSSQLSYWATTGNMRYVMVVEGMINDGFSLHQRSEDGHGTYGRRSAQETEAARDVCFIPPHLYGQLAQTKQGLELLLAENSFWEMIVTLQRVSSGSSHCRLLQSEQKWLEVKAAIWGLASVAASSSASKLLEQAGVISSLVQLAESCPVLSLQGSAYYALGLVASTGAGSAALGSRGWVTIRHCRGDSWPIATDWLGETDLIRDSHSLTASQTTQPPASSPASDTEEDSQGPGLVRTNTQSSDTGTVVMVRPSPSKRFSEKVTSWFRNIDLDKKREPSTSNGKSTRRNSEGSRGLASSIRHSLRLKRPSLGSGRPRTTSFGSLPASKENTPQSVGPGGNDGGSRLVVVEEDRVKRKLSFGQDSQDTEGELQASPGELPGEMFPLDNIVEEPEKVTVAVALRTTSLSTSSSGLSSLSTAGQLRQQDSVTTVTTAKHHSVSRAINIDRGATVGPTVQSEDMSAGSVPQLEQIEDTDPASILTQPEVSARGGEISLLGVIRQGTSVSSVSSIGSYSFQENPGYSTRTRKRRPQLSESEDGDPIVGPRQGVVRHDSYSRNTFPIRARQKPSAALSVAADSVNRSVSVPPKILPATLPRSDSKEPTNYWGLAFPLNPSVLQPPEPPPDKSPQSPAQHVVPMPVPLSILYTNGLYTHEQQTCLICHSKQSIVRPRSSSMSVEPCVFPEDYSERRQSCFSLSSSKERQPLPISDESPSGSREAVCEVLQLISNLNNPAKQSENALLKLQRKFPSLFRNLCLYCDVSVLLGEFQFRSSSRKFIQELFVDCFEEMDSVAISLLGLHNSLDT